MENLFVLEENESFNKIVELLKADKIKLNNLIIERLCRAGVLQGLEDCGKMIEEIIDGTWGAFEVTAFALRVCRNDLKELFKSLVVMSTEGDCPMCGCDVEVEEEGAWNQVWEIKSCTNCDYSETDEPDWDRDRD